MEDFKGKIDWIELVTHYRCNCSCKVCPTARISSSGSLSLEEIGNWLQMGKKLGASGVWFGGGEPTMHDSLAKSVEWSKRLGYKKILIQTNGLRLAYPAYAERLIKAGINMVNLSMKGADARTHDDMTRVQGSFELMKMAAKNLYLNNIHLGADILVTSKSVVQLKSMTELASELGATSVTVMLVSLHGLDKEKDINWLPTSELLAEHMQIAMDKAVELGIEITSLHVPPCLLAKRHRNKYFHAGLYRLLVIAPGQSPFLAETSPTEGGSYLDICDNCSERQKCLGFTSEYLTMNHELAPI